MNKKFSTSKTKRILITDAGCNLGLYVIDYLSKEPYIIRAQIKNPNHKKNVLLAAKNLKYQIEIINTNQLVQDDFKDIEIVIHLSTRVPTFDETKLVFELAFLANVKRLVFRSSAVAVYDFESTDRIFTENDWPDICRTEGYIQSIIFIERFAWNYVEERLTREGRCFELSAINPGAIIGPNYKDLNLNEESLIEAYLKGSPVIDWEIYIGQCDVRDVALALVRACFNQQCFGNRHLISSESKWISTKKAYDILRHKYGKEGFYIHGKFKRTIPDNDPNNKTDLYRMKKVLGIKPIKYKKSVLDSAESLIKSGKVVLI